MSLPCPKYPGRMALFTELWRDMLNLRDEGVNRLDLLLFFSKVPGFRFSLSEFVGVFCVLTGE